MDHHIETTAACVTENQKETVLVPAEVDLLQNFSQLQQRERWKTTGWVNESDFTSQQPINDSFQLQAKNRTHKSLPADCGGLSTGYLINYDSIGNI